MSTTCRRVLALVGLLVGFASLGAAALPGFSDQNVSAGNLNPTDTIKVQEIRVTPGAGDVTLASITVQNLGTAGDGDIDKITVMDGGDVLGETTAISGLGSGITINLGGFDLGGVTHYLKIYVTVGTAVVGGETVNLRVRVHYVVNGSSYTSSWISDLTGETIRNGGFDEIEDASPDAGYMNPGDADVVQTTVFTDVDANGQPVAWQGAGTTTVVQVENLGTGLKTSDIVDVRVLLTVGGVEYEWDGDGVAAGVQDWGTWNPASPMVFSFERFKSSADALVGLPAEIADNGVLTVTVMMRIAGAGTVVDGRTIRTKTTVKVQEQGQDSVDAAVRYDQASSSETSQTIRKQGFEEIGEESQSLGSGTAATGNIIVQTIRATDEDRNGDAVRTYRVYIRNTGTAEGTEINKIEVKAGATTLWTLDNSPAPHNLLPNFKTGFWYDFTLPAGTPWFDVADDHDQVFKIYYTIGVPVDGHTLKPAVRLEGREPSPAGQTYSSDEVVYPDTLALYLPGFEFVENETPPEGGTAYSGQRLLAQTIRVEDLDEDDDNVTIHPVVVKNIGTATGNPDVTKVEVWRRNTPTATAIKLGETTDLTGFRTGGARVELTHDNVVTDASGGAEAYLDIYLTIAEPEVMVAGRTIQLETRVLHTENLQSFDKMVVSNQWTLETNHRPVADFTFAAATAPAGVQAKADFTYEQTIQFNGTATDSDGDLITGWAWNFGDGSTAAVQNPTHRYPNGGTFTVTLTVTDARGVTGSVSKTITVEGPPNVVPTATFTWTPQEPAQGQTVTFTSTVTDTDQPGGTPHIYGWNFGDGTTSVVANPQHAFAAKQTYTVRLTVTDAQSASTIVEHTVSVGNTAPTLATLTATPAAPNTGDPVTFTSGGYADADGDLVDHYRWNFDDGVTDDDGAATATHTFNAPGTYTVSVIAVDARGGESLAKTIIITVSGPTRVIVYAYPNPASTQATFNLLLPDGTTDPVVRIFSMDGRLVLEEELPAGATTYLWNLLDSAGDPVGNGLYFCIATGAAAGGGTVRSEIFRLLVAR